MHPLIQRVSDLFEDLRRRRVLRAGGLFWIGSLAVLGALDLVRDLVPWLDRGFPALVLTAILLFPVVLIVAWAFDWDADGLQLYRPAEAEALSLAHRIGILSLLGMVSFGFGWGVLSLWSTSPVLSKPPGLIRDASPTDIAVLYFDDHSPGGEFGYLAAGLTDGLISALGNVESLTVTSRNGVRAFQDTPVSTDSIARALDVGTMVMGSVTGVGGRVRVFAQLVDVTAGDHQLWNGEFEHDEDDILTLQSELVEEISAGLRQSLGVAVRSREAAAETTDDEAWLLFQEAKTTLDRALADVGVVSEFTRALLERADSLLGLAHQRDPEWAAPVVERGWLAFEESRRFSPIAGFVEQADSLVLLARANDAVDLSDGSAEALELRGVVQLELFEASGGAHWREAGETDLLNAVRQDPERARALAYLARSRRLTGDFLDARLYAQRALAADAFLEDVEDLIYGLYVVSVELKEWEGADRWCREGRRRFSQSLLFPFCRMQYEALRPDLATPAVAWALLDTIRRESTPEDWDFQYRTWSGYQVARVLARNQMMDSARTVMEEYTPGPTDRPWFAYDEAHVHLVMGDEEAALEALEVYLRVAPDRRAYLQSDWLFEELWPHPRFQELTASPTGG